MESVDGVINGLKYALGRSATSTGGTNGVTRLPGLAWTGSVAARLPALAIDLLSPGPMDVTYEVEVSDTLDSWTTILEKVGNNAWAGIGVSGATFTAVTAVDRTVFTVTDPGAHHFLRLKATSNQ